MLRLDEISPLTTEELLTAFERISTNGKLPVSLYQPEKYFWYIKDVIRDRLPSEIENTKNLERLNYLFSVAKRMYDQDLCRVIKDKIEEIKKPPSSARRAIY